MLSDLTSDFHNWGYRYITRDIIFYLYQTSPRLLEDDKFDYLIRFSHLHFYYISHKIAGNASIL